MGKWLSFNTNRIEALARKTAFFQKSYISAGNRQILGLGLRSV